MTKQSLNINVLTVSDSRTEENDTSGQFLCDAIRDSGHTFCKKQIVPDDIFQLRAVVSQWIASPDINVIISTGGTGLTGRDTTPEALAPLFEKEIPGFGELFRMLSFEDVRTSTIQSRCVAGVANGTYIFTLPGSTGACRLGWNDIIKHQLDETNKPCNLVQVMPRLKEKL